MNAEEAALQVELQQLRHDAAIADLPHRFDDHAAAIKWILGYVDSASADCIRGQDTQRVIRALEASGYSYNDRFASAGANWTDPDFMARFFILVFITHMHNETVHHAVGHLTKLGNYALELLERNR